MIKIFSNLSKLSCQVYFTCINNCLIYNFFYFSFKYKCFLPQYLQGCHSLGSCTGSKKPINLTFFTNKPVFVWAVNIVTLGL